MEITDKKKEILEKIKKILDDEGYEFDMKLNISVKPKIS